VAAAAAEVGNYKKAIKKSRPFSRDFLWRYFYFVKIYLNTCVIYSATTPGLAFEILSSPALKLASVKLLYCSGINPLNSMI
jgi:hypothetical protein